MILPSTEKLRDYEPAIPQRRETAVKLFRWNIAAGLDGTEIVRAIFWFAVATLGTLQAWSTQLSLVNDTISYLDAGDFIWHRQWSMAINGVWSPLYSGMLGVTLGIIKPSARWQYPVVHLLLLAIFFFTAWAFDRFVRELFGVTREFAQSEHRPLWAWLSMCYIVFLWGTLRLIGVGETNPDMLVAAWVFVICWLLIKVQRGQAQKMQYAGLGFILALGFLTKAIMFPVALFCLGALCLMSKRGRVQGAVIALVIFVACTAPWVTGLSLARSRLTFGESGTYNYAVHINHLPRLHWQGEPHGSGSPRHPTRQIYFKPPIFEFGSPFTVTYPVWYDPSYWYDGVKVKFDLRSQVWPTIKRLIWELGLLFQLSGAMVSALFVLLYLSGRGWSLVRDRRELWFLIGLSLFVLVLYASVHFETRYLAPFLVVLVTSLLASVHLPLSRVNNKVVAAFAVFMLAMFFSPFDGAFWSDAGAIRNVLKPLHPDANSYQVVAEEARSMGLRTGDQIASLECSYFDVAMWARLAKLRIVAEDYYCPFEPETFGNSFWLAEPKVRGEIISVIRKTGARAIVSGQTPAGEDAATWVRVGNTKYYMFWLHRSDVPNVSLLK